MYCLNSVLTNILSDDDQKNRMEVLLGFAASIFSAKDDSL